MKNELLKSNLSTEDEDLLNCVRKELNNNEISFESALDILLSDFNGIYTKLFSESAKELLFKNGSYSNKEAVAMNSNNKPVIVKCGYKEACQKLLREHLYNNGISKKSLSARTQERRTMAIGMNQYRQSSIAYIFTPDEFILEEQGESKKLSLR